MNLKKIIEHDQRAFEKMKNFQLPNIYKRIGFFTVLGTFLVMATTKTIEDRPDWMLELLERILLMGFLMISLAKEQLEDERIVHIRAQSYAIALIMGVLYAVLQPYVNYAVALFVAPEKASLEMSYFQVLVFILLVQVLYFEVKKK